MTDDEWFAQARENLGNMPNAVLRRGVWPKEITLYSGGLTEVDVTELKDEPYFPPEVVDTVIEPDNRYVGGKVYVDDTLPAPPPIQSFERAYHGKSLPGETCMDASRRLGAEVKRMVDRDFADREEPSLITVTQYEVFGAYEFWFTVGEWKF